MSSGLATSDLTSPALIFTNSYQRFDFTIKGKLTVLEEVVT